MGKVTNTFVKSKLNKDLDARLLPNGEYRDAQNVQVSRSEGADVGSLENVLGNELVKNGDFAKLTGNNDLLCIGQLADDTNNRIYVFLTDYTDDNPAIGFYEPTANNYIYRYDITKKISELLVEGSFLNFSKTNPITGVNLLEDLLFWTDNRNQPRKINVDFATQSIPYYVNEDQISVAKYNPYKAIELFREITPEMAVDNPALSPGVGDYQTTMVDVTSKYFPNGGSANISGYFPAGGTIVVLNGVKGDILSTGNPYDPSGVAGADISYIDSAGAMVSTGTKVTDVDTPGSDSNIVEITADGPLPEFINGTELIFNPNVYYDENFVGDPNYLDDLFVRFSYRFRFDDGEYSIFAPFTQIAFIPKQDGYFMYVKADRIPGKDDQTSAYRSTVVSFMENKVDDILLRLPFPDTITPGSGIDNNLKIAEIDILYKESDGLAVKVVETIQIADAIQEEAHWVYNYRSIKPIKTLPADEIIRVYDKTPVKALAQEIISNRVVYGNYQNKHTPPASLNYNVATTEKSDWNLMKGDATAVGSQPSSTTVNISNIHGTIIVGGTITGWANEPLETVTVVTVTGTPPTQITTDISTGGISAAELITFNPSSEDSNRTSVVEYPNHSLKQNRSYQVGVILSDRYGRQSTVILSNNRGLGGPYPGNFKASTIYLPYIGEEVEQNEWTGESLKVLFNDVIGPAAPNQGVGWPGIYEGDVNSLGYNPLGWYTYKIVVKQTGQEYYNVYLGGIMASYPEDTTLEIGNTSHTSLINDNINKVPRDLNRVGPDQKQYRSSIGLFGRVENMSTSINYAPEPYPTNIGVANGQYYPAREADRVSTISTLQDLFDYDPTNPPKPNYYPQIYLAESNPLVARISTESKIGQISTTNYEVGSATVKDATTGLGSVVVLTGIAGVLVSGMVVTGKGIPENTKLLFAGGGYSLTKEDGTTPLPILLPAGTELSFAPAFVGLSEEELKTPGLQYLAVYETEPVESSLDIFWETSTSGIISDLNNLILNTIGGGAKIEGFNTNNWNESISWTPEAQANILSSSFRVVDNFGVIVTGLTVNGGVGVDSISLDSVINQTLPLPFSENVQLPLGSEYFELFQASPNFFNIRVKKPYWDNIYYGADATVRNFEFNIKTTIGGLDTIYPENGGVNNVGVTLTPITIPCNTTLNTTRYVEKLIKMEGVNGSSNPELRNEALEWSIISQKEAITGEDVDFFSLTDIDTPDYVSEAWLSNTLPGDIPPIDYRVIVRLADPEDRSNCIFDLRMGVVPTMVEEWTFTWKYRCAGLGSGFGYPAETRTDSMVIIHVPDPVDPTQDSFYIPNVYTTTTSNRGLGVHATYYNGSFYGYVNSQGMGPALSIDGVGPFGWTLLDWIKEPTAQAAFDKWRLLLVETCGCPYAVNILEIVSLDKVPIDVDAFQFEVLE